MLIQIQLRKLLMSEKLVRISTIIKIIANNPAITMGALHQKLEDFEISVTERTLAKDIKSLKQDYQLLPDKERLREGYILNDIVCLSSKEQELVLDALSLLGLRMDDPDATNLVSRLGELNLKSKYCSASGIQRKRSLRTRNILEKEHNYQDKINTIYDAIGKSAAIQFEYKTPRLKDSQVRSGYPLLMVFHERGWYCVMRDLKTNNYFPNRIDRVKNIEILESTSTNLKVDENLNECSYLINCGWGMSFPKNIAVLKEAESKPPIVVRFESSVATYILEARHRHPKAKIEPTKDGSGDVLMEIIQANPNEFLDWVRSFGSKAWVVSPSSIRANEQAEAKRMLERYSSK